MNFFSTKIAYAQSSGSGSGLNVFIGKVEALIINPLIYLLFALAVIYFLYGVFEFLMNQTNEEKKTSGKSHMLWGVIGITIMLGVWTLLSIVLNTLGISKTQIDPEQGTVNLQ